MISVIVTTYNEEANLPALLKSLEGQGAHEVILVDAKSTDQTVAVAKAFEDRLPLSILVQACKRGEGRNLGAAIATGDRLAFIDGDCRAAPGWIEAMEGEGVIAGDTVFEGRKAFTRMQRVELPHKGADTTWPSCNLSYPKPLFDQLGGFDPEFVTAEDIDLNYRALEAGALLVHQPAAKVHARVRGSVRAFLRQAYWNGYGRKQLSAKHGGLWHEYRFVDMIRRQFSFWGLLRLAAGTLGYLRAKWGPKA